MCVDERNEHTEPAFLAFVRNEPAFLAFVRTEPAFLALRLCIWQGAHTSMPQKPLTHTMDA